MGHLMDGEDCFSRLLKRHSDPFHIDGGNEDTPKPHFVLRLLGTLSNEVRQAIL